MPATATWHLGFAIHPKALRARGRALRVVRRVCERWRMTGAAAPPGTLEPDTWAPLLARQEIVLVWSDITPQGRAELARIFSGIAGLRLRWFTP